MEHSNGVGPSEVSQLDLFMAPRSPHSMLISRWSTTMHTSGAQVAPWSEAGTGRDARDTL
jgi:hypothetical protein